MIGHVYEHMLTISVMTCDGENSMLHADCKAIIKSMIPHAGSIGNTGTRNFPCYPQWPGLVVGKSLEERCCETGSPRI